MYEYNQAKLRKVKNNTAEGMLICRH